MRKICLSLPWNPDALDSMLEWAQDADATGVDSIWINEGFGHVAPDAARGRGYKNPSQKSSLSNVRQISASRPVPARIVSPSSM